MKDERYILPFLNYRVPMGKALGKKVDKVPQETPEEWEYLGFQA